MTFNEAVTGVDLSDFAMALTGTVNGNLASVTSVSSSVYSVTISGITGAGSLGLNLVDNNTIRNVAGDGLDQPNAPASFQSQATFATGIYPFALAVADLNGDGIPDMAVVNGVNSVGIFLGNGDGTFQLRPPLPRVPRR